MKKTKDEILVSAVHKFFDWSVANTFYEDFKIYDCENEQRQKAPNKCCFVLKNVGNIPNF